MFYLHTRYNGSGGPFVEKIEGTSARSVYTCVQMQKYIGQAQWYVLSLDNEIHIHHPESEGQSIFEGFSPVQQQVVDKI